MLGGAYLCFEAAEKIWEKLSGHDHAAEAVGITDPKELEDRQVSGAIRTDLILSAEILAITLNELTDQSIVMQGLVLGAVSIAITALVYGAVALIVKMDDIGLNLAARASSVAQAVGRGLVAAMPRLLVALSVIGTAAMVWVGGGIIVHGLEGTPLETLPHVLHDVSEGAGAATGALGGIVAWVVQALGSAVVGLIVGGVIVLVYHRVKAMRGAKPAAAH